MGKKNKAESSLGRSLIKDRFGGGGKKLVADNSMVNFLCVIFFFSFTPHLKFTFL